MTQDTDTSREARFFILKNGVYSRPNSRGYTTRPISAGLYTQEEAEEITHPNGPDGPRDGMFYIAEHLCTDESWQAHRAIKAERDTLRTQLAAARDAALEEAAKNLIDHANGDFEDQSGERAWCVSDDFIFALKDALKSTTPAPREVTVQEAARVLHRAWLEGQFESSADEVLQDLIDSGVNFDCHDAMENWFRAIAQEGGE